MSININNDQNFPTETEAYYETVASQEEVYLEETEEELRMILTFDDPPPSQDNSGMLLENRGKPELLWKERSTTHADDNFHQGESLEEQLKHAAEELITGDSDDPPLGEKAIGEI